MEIQRETEFDCYRVNFGLVFTFCRAGKGEGEEGTEWAVEK